MQDLTAMIIQWQAGDNTVQDKLFELLYSDLVPIATRLGARDLEDPASVISGMWLQLSDNRGVPVANRGQFFRMCGHLMNRYLLQSARSKRAEKRGGDQQPITLIESLAGNKHVDFLSLHEALSQLIKINSRQAEIVSLRFFVGLNMPNIAKVLDISLATANRDWRVAKGFLSGLLKK